MSHPSSFSEQFEKVFEPNPRGVVGIVDELLSLCVSAAETTDATRGRRLLELDWHDGTCAARFLRMTVQEAGVMTAKEVAVASTRTAQTTRPLSKSVFRAILARFAALCDEYATDSVTPYGGDGVIAVRTNPPTLLRVAFRNTPTEQRLEIHSVGGMTLTNVAPATVIGATDTSAVTSPDPA